MAGYRNALLSLLPAGAAVLTAACAALHPPPPAALALRDTVPLTSPPATSTATWPTAQWWHDYADTGLNSLVESAISQAPGIASADARIRAAEQEVRVAGAARGLRMDANAQLSRQRLSDNALLPTEFLGFNWYEQSDLGVTVRYQFDWWGKQSAAMAAALDRSRARAAERHTAALGLAAAVCDNYFAWQALSARITLQEESIRLLGQGLRLAERRAAAELDRADTVIAVRQRLGAHREELATLLGQQQLQFISLAALLGVSPNSLPPLPPQTLPRPASSLPADAGTNLLARRPDIVASRWRVEAALRDTDVARANFYPDVSLRALVGLSSIDLSRLLRADSGVPLVGAAVDLPLFDAGLRRARHGAAEASLALAIAAYDEAVVNAAREAGAAAAAIDQATAQRQAREQLVADAHALLAVARVRVQGQLTHLGPQLEARLAEITEQDALVRVDLAALRADIQLKQALGGGSAHMEAPE
jgi:outer membrane protein, multidrug efflux system